MFPLAHGGRVRAQHVIDPASTVLAFMGTTSPSDMEGQPIEGLLAPGVPSPRRGEIDWEQDPLAGEPLPS